MELIHEESACWAQRAAQARLRAQRPIGHSVVDDQRARVRLMRQLIVATTMGAARQLRLTGEWYRFALVPAVLASRHGGSTVHQGTGEMMRCWVIGQSESGTSLLRADSGVGVLHPGAMEAYVDTTLLYDDYAALFREVFPQNPALHEIAVSEATKLRRQLDFDRQFARDIGLPHLVPFSS